MVVNQQPITSITIGGETMYGGNVEISAPGATIDPDTGEIVFPSGGAPTRKEFTLTNDDITNKFILVDADITDDEKTIMNVESLPKLYYGSEFVVDGTNKKKIKWDTLSLDGVLVVGDEVEIIHY